MLNIVAFGRIGILGVGLGVGAGFVSVLLAAMVGVLLICQVVVPSGMRA